MKFFATILICAGTMDPAECQTDTALSVVSMPEPASGLGERRDREGPDRVGRPRGRPAVTGGVVVTVPRAPQPPLLDRALAERATLVRAPVVDGAVAPSEVRHGERAATDADRRDPTLGQLVRGEHAVPFERTVGEGSRIEGGFAHPVTVGQGRSPGDSTGTGSVSVQRSGTAEGRLHSSAR